MKALTVLTFIFAAFLMASSAVADEPATKPTAAHFSSLDEAKAAAAVNDRKILLEFYATW
ncbi:MAG: hypothetical protein ACOYVF_12520 [Candidatus Zixiibacteriota bacterium]